MMELFLKTEECSDILVSTSKDIIYTSEWENEEKIPAWLDKLQTSEFPSTLTVKGMKSIKLHASPFNLIYRSIQGEKVLIGAIVPIDGLEFYIIALVAQSSSMQLQTTALKDIIESIIKISQQSTEIVVIDSNTIQVNVSFRELKNTIKIFMNSLKHMHFLVDYTDKGNAVIFKFQYKKEEKKVYSVEVYKQYMKN